MSTRIDVAVSFIVNTAIYMEVSYISDRYTYTDLISDPQH